MDSICEAQIPYALGKVGPLACGAAPRRNAADDVFGRDSAAIRVVGASVVRSAARSCHNESPRSDSASHHPRDLPPRPGGKKRPGVERAQTRSGSQPVPGAMMGAKRSLQWPQIGFECHRGSALPAASG